MLKKLNTKEIECYYWPYLKINISEFRLILLDHITYSSSLNKIRWMKNTHGTTTHPGRTRQKPLGYPAVNSDHMTIAYGAIRGVVRLKSPGFLVIK